MVSYAQNGEDVVLQRALRDVAVGRYVDVGANHPTDDSISRSFYDRGWRGLTVEPVDHFADLHRAERPGDVLVQAVVTDSQDEQATLHVYADTGLSTLVDSVRDAHSADGWTEVDVSVPTVRLDAVLEDLGWQGEPIHFMTVDTEGAEADVLATIDLRRWRPWVLVIEATAPNTTVPTHDAWEPGVLADGYRFCLFDGLSRFYVAEEHADRLAPLLAYPACVHDGFVTRDRVRLEGEVARLHGAVEAGRHELAAAHEDAERLRTEVAEHAAELERTREELAARTAELAALHGSVSWRITEPLRSVRRRLPAR